MAIVGAALIPILMGTDRGQIRHDHKFLRSDGLLRGDRRVWTVLEDAPRLVRFGRRRESLSDCKALIPIRG